jgi:hypothetical protein
MNSLWDIRIFLGLVPKESPCINQSSSHYNDHAVMARTSSYKIKWYLVQNIIMSSYWIRKVTMISYWNSSTTSVHICSNKTNLFLLPSHIAHLPKECHNSKFGIFELLVKKETFADALFNSCSVITQFAKLAAGEQLCRRCTHRKL